jgi:predicted AlkP superfamily pyrophosphatase or phosphodiesterase
MPRSLIVFIDALPFDSLGGAPFLARMATARPLVPGFGYSVNIKAELFAGLTPDDLGVLSEWTLKDGRFARRKRWWRALAPLSRFPFVDRAAHYALSRALGARLFAIPFGFLPHFDVTIPAAYEDGFPRPSLFNGGRTIARVLYSRHRATEARDRAVFDDALRAVRERTDASVFVAFAGLDEALHAHGVTGDGFAATLAELDGLVARLAGEFLSRTKGGRVVVLSDHGGADVTREIAIDLERAVGPAGPSTYLYFVDSTMLRVWTFNDAARARVLEFLRDLPGGRILPTDERERLAVASPGLAEILFLLDEGAIFNPSFFGRERVAGMHGYHPELPRQRGVFCVNVAIDDPPTRAREVFPFLDCLLSE